MCCSLGHSILYKSITHWAINVRSTAQTLTSTSTTHLCISYFTCFKIIFNIWTSLNHTKLTRTFGAKDEMQGLFRPFSLPSTRETNESHGSSASGMSRRRPNLKKSLANSMCLENVWKLLKYYRLHQITLFLQYDVSLVLFIVEVC